MEGIDKKILDFMRNFDVEDERRLLDFWDPIPGRKRPNAIDIWVHCLKIRGQAKTTQEAVLMMAERHWVPYDEELLTRLHGSQVNTHFLPKF